MAKVKIQGHATGTGIITIAAPNTNTNRTLTLPDADVTLGTPEGTVIKSTGESGGTKFLREDGDGTCSWQAAGGGGGATELISTTKITSSTQSVEITGINAKYRAIKMYYGFVGHSRVYVVLGNSGTYTTASIYSTGSGASAYMQLDGGWGQAQAAGKAEFWQIGDTNGRTVIFSTNVEMKTDYSVNDILSRVESRWATENTTAYDSIKIYSPGAAYTSGFVNVYGIPDS